MTIISVKFIGVGAACDPGQANTSLLVTVRDSGQQQRILLDCGFTVPPALFRHGDDVEQLEYIWISHLHGDHFMGLPLLFLCLWEAGRRKALTIIGHNGVEAAVLAAFELAYPGLHARLAYDLRFVALRAEETVSIGSMDMRAMAVDHSQAACGLLLTAGARRLYYSGDGRPTGRTAALIRHVDLVVHEAYRLEIETPGHATMRDCLELAARAEISLLALVHLRRDERLPGQGFLRRPNPAGSCRAFVPEAGDVVIV